VESACNKTNLDAEHISPEAGVIGPDANRGFGCKRAVARDAAGAEAYER
jgi:hypothetical protein